MSKENFCNDGKCKINRKGEKHELHKDVSMKIDSMEKFEVKMNTWIRD